MTAMLGLSIVARLPVAMLSIGLLVRARAATGECAAAGAAGVGGPRLGRAADRRVRSVVLAVAALGCPAAPTATGVPPPAVGALPRAAPAVAAGTTLPPVRARLPSLTSGAAGSVAFAATGLAAAVAAGIALARAHTLPGAVVPTPQGATT